MKKNNHSAQDPNGLMLSDSIAQSFLYAIDKHKKFFFLLMCFGILLSSAFVISTDTKYEASATIEVNAHNDGQFKNEINILESNELTLNVIRKLNLQNDPEFNKGSNKKTDILDTTQAFTNNQTTKPINYDIIVKNLQKNLTLQSTTKSSTVKISFSSHDAKKSALITNTYVDIFTKQSLNIHSEKHAQQTQQLDEKKNSLIKKVQLSKFKLENFKIKNNLNRNSPSLLTSHLDDLSKKIIKTESDYNELQLELKEIRKSSSSKERIRFAIEKDTITKEFSARKVNLEAELYKLSSRYGPKHPKMIQKTEALYKINNRLSHQAQETHRAIQKEVEFQAALTKEKLNFLKRRKSNAVNQEIKNGIFFTDLINLNQEIETSQNSLHNFLQTYNDNANKNENLNTDIAIISLAKPPLKKSNKNKIFIFIASLLCSTIISLIATFLRCKFYSKFTDTKSLESKYGYACLATIPSIDLEDIHNNDVIKEALSSPSSNLINAIHSLRLNLKKQISKQGKQPTVISMMSALKSEGKTTTAILLAALSAKAGERVILIDTNLHNPTIHKMVRSDNDKNLVDFLTDQNPLNDVIYKDKTTNLDIVFGCNAPNNAFDLLSLNKLEILFKALRQNYDLIIVDTVASTTALDASLIEALSDYNLYCVKYNATRGKDLTNSLKPYLSQRKNTLGFVLTQAKI